MKIMTQSDSYDTMKFAVIKIRYMRNMLNVRMDYDKMLMRTEFVYFMRSEPNSVAGKVSGTK